MMTTFNIVSPCCHREVVGSTKMEFPLGGSRFGIAYKVDVCDGCGLEVEYPVEQCGVCGHVGCEGDCE
jgi:hypothetical protein